MAHWSVDDEPAELVPSCPPAAPAEPPPSAVAGRNWDHEPDPWTAEHEEELQNCGTGRKYRH
jgi:hypothetical protein